jgi:hypothetical protein
VACAAACITVSRNIVRVAREMRSNDLLEGEEWLAVCALFFAIMSLSFYVLSNESAPVLQPVIEEAKAGYEVIKFLAEHSIWADHFSKTLEVL